MKRLFFFSLTVIFCSSALAAAEPANYITDLSTIQILSNQTILESPNLPENYGKFIDMTPEYYGFVPYDGGLLQRRGGFGESIFTTRTCFSISSELSNAVICFFFNSTDYPTDYYLNGVFIYRRGSFEGRYDSIILEASRFFIPPALIRYGEHATNEIAAQGYPQHEVFPMAQIAIGGYEIVTRYVFLKNMLTIHLARGSMMIALILFLYYMFLFFSRGRGDKKYLYFGLMCLVFTFAQMNVAFNFDFTSELILEIFSRACFPLSSIFLTLFVMEFTKILSKNRLLKILIFVPLGLISMAEVFAKTKLDTQVIFGLTSMIVIPITLIFSLVLLLISFIKTRKARVLILFLGMMLTALASLRDLILIGQFKIPLMWFNSYGYLVIVLSVFGILAYEQGELYREAATGQKELDAKNHSLSDVMVKIGQVSGNLRQSSLRLETSVKNTVETVDQFESGNTRIYSAIEERFAGIDELINSVKDKIIEKSENIPKAVQNQSEAVGQVVATVTELNNHIQSTLDAASETNEAAQKVSGLADSSAQIIQKSKESILKLTQYSDVILGVLKSMQELTETSNTLAINASIEAVRAGQAGKGFAVVSAEMRKLSNLTQFNLTSSVKNIREMVEVVNLSDELADEVATSLTQMMDQSKDSAKMIQNITGLVERQRDEFDSILNAVESLYNETMTFKKLSEDDVKENLSLRTSLEELKATFSTIAELLNEQKTRKESFVRSMDEIRSVIEENSRIVELLNETIIH